MGMAKEFKEFAMKGNMMDMASASSLVRPSARSCLLLLRMCLCPRLGCCLVG